MAVLRTPDERFADLPDVPFAPHYIEVDSVRMHYLDQGPADGYDAPLRTLIPGARGQREVMIAGGGHFLLEDKGRELSDVVVDLLTNTPS